ncbi:MAG: VOC family protein [Planctomycetes bacterium]|jgi:PhnB protein|nr:VOC family protein [Planctomycetota bacterium]
MPCKPIPDGYTSLTPHLTVDGAARAIDFYVMLFGGSELMRMPAGNKIAHAEIQIGNARLMIADEFPEHAVRGPRHYGGSPMSMLVYLPDVEIVLARAVRSGCKVIKPLAKQYYGDRTATFEDPFGHKWTIATHIEDVMPDELARRAQLQNN